ncbi:hypothetical protein KUTeg_008354 [Tegillarca granosa]|uniref:Uncharacterized protein n=1 Tax=Tegillarca granosa TaxID=220873 RepID=A0ABQ9F8X9_TEGGR|nr:hypothetical protein KUTeg_008354 [Tegillarca granosa]
MKKNIAIVCSTGIATSQYGELEAQTLHKWAGLGDGRRKQLEEKHHDDDDDDEFDSNKFYHKFDDDSEFSESEIEMLEILGNYPDETHEETFHVAGI